MKRASGAATSRMREQRERVDHAGDGGARAGADVGGGAGDGAGGGDAAEERRDDVGDALGDEFDVGVVAVAAHAVGDDGGEQAFDGGEQGDGEGGGQEREDVLGVEVGKCEMREAAGECRRSGCRWSRRAGGKAATATVASEERDDGAGNAPGEARQEQDDGERGCGDGDGLPADGGGVVRRARCMRARNSLGTGGRAEAEEVFDLGGGDQQGDAVGEADDDGTGDELDGGAEAGEAHDEQHDAGHERDQREAGDAEAGDDAGDDDDEGAGGSADLGARAAEGGDEEAGDDGGVEAGLRRDAGGDAEGHGERKSDEADGEPATRSWSERAEGVAWRRHSMDRGRQARRGRSGGHRRVLHLVEHADGFFELGVEVFAHQGEDFADGGVADGVEDLVACLAVDDDLFGAEDGEVLGDVGLFHAELFDEGAGGELAFAEEFKDGDAGGVGEGLEDVGFELAEGVGHSVILAFSHILMLLEGAWRAGRIDDRAGQRPRWCSSGGWGSQASRGEASSRSHAL